MAWNLKSAGLPTLERVNNSTVKGLELSELGGLEIRSPLFSYSPLSFSNQTPGSGSKGENNPSGQVPVVDKETQLMPETVSFIYKIDNIWNFDSLTFVSAANQLGPETYTHLFGNTIVITNETSIAATAVFFAYLPLPSEVFEYEIDLAGQGVTDITKVEVEGLLFTDEASQTFIYDEENEILTLNANATCRPKQNSFAEIYSTKTFGLSAIDKLTTYIFDVSSLNLSYVTYLDYLGEGYSIASSLSSGTLINNYSTKKVLAFK
jgi:hypothetical protein